MMKLKRKESELVDVDDFRSKMEKIFKKNPYLECKEAPKQNQRQTLKNQRN
jgi:hypothetical protein